MGTCSPSGLIRVMFSCVRMTSCNESFCANLRALVGCSVPRQRQLVAPERHPRRQDTTRPSCSAVPMALPVIACPQHRLTRSSTHEKTSTNPSESRMNMSLRERYWSIPATCQYAQAQHTHQCRGSRGEPGGRRLQTACGTSLRLRDVRKERMSVGVPQNCGGHTRRIVDLHIRAVDEPDRDCALADAAAAHHCHLRLEVSPRPRVRTLRRRIA